MDELEKESTQPSEVLKTSKQGSFISHFLSLGLGSIVYLLVGLIGTPIITRLVDPVDYGRMSLLTVYANMGMLFLSLGMDQAFVRFFYHEDSVDYQRKLLHTCIKLPMILAMIIGIILFPIFLSTNHLGFTHQSITDLILLEGYIIVLLLQRYSMLVVRLKYHTKLYSTINVIQKITYIVLTVVLVIIFKAYFYIILAISTIISTLIALVISIVFEREMWRFKSNTDLVSIPRKELLRYGIPIMFSGGISVLFEALGKLAINHYGTKTDVGIYASAMSLIAIFSIVKTSFTTLWVPSSIEHFEKHPDDKTYYQKGNSFITLLMVSFGAGVILFKDLIVMLLGSKYHSAAQILPLLMFEPILYTISETTTTGIVVQKKTIYQIIVASGSLIVNLIGNIILIPLIGSRGAAVSTAISYIVFFALRTFLSNRVFYVDYHLGRFSVVIMALLLYAIYGSMNSFSAIHVLLFVGVEALLFILYRKECLMAVRYGFNMLKKHKK